MVIEEVEEIGDKKTIGLLEDNMFNNKMKMIGEMIKNNNSSANKKRMGMNKGNKMIGMIKIIISKKMNGENKAIKNKLSLQMKTNNLKIDKSVEGEVDKIKKIKINNNLNNKRILKANKLVKSLL